MAGLANGTLTQVNDGVSSPIPPNYDMDLVAYVTVGILGAIIWDIFSNLGEDYELIQRSPIGLPIIVYFLSRTTTLSCFVLIVIFSTGINVDCATLLRATHWTFAFGLSLTTLLLVLRARAVYQNQKQVANFLSAIWLGVVAAALVETALGSLGIRDASSGRCVNVHTITPFIIATTIVPMANDIAIFCAITWKLVQNSHEELTMRSGLMAAVFGRHLPSFSRTLLRDGQAYFLTMIVVSTTTIGLFCFAPKAVEGFSALLGFLNVGVMHLMTCKIYRKTRLGVRRPESAVDSSALSLGPMAFRARRDSSSVTTRADSSAGMDRGVGLGQQKFGEDDEEGANDM
ncbi:hypothetical protein BJ912DRAFT_951433 [Pholiota molesta]|nr:hypothetical protein BJ912DRAFT_951433 [Pholiota molesta]